MPAQSPAPHSLVLRSLILVGLVGFGLVLVAAEGLLGSEVAGLHVRVAPERYLKETRLDPRGVHALDLLG